MAAFIAAILLLVFPFSTSAKTVIHVYNWDDFMDLSILGYFEKESGIRVIYKTYSSEHEIRRLIEGSDAGDVAIVPQFLLPYLIEKKHLQKLGRAQLSIHKNMDVFFAGRTRLIGAYDYALPYLWYGTALGFNRKSIARVLGDDFEEDWSLLFDSAKSGKIKECGIALADAPLEFYAELLDFSGYPVAMRDTPLNRLHRLSQKTLPSIKQNLRYIDSERYLYDLGKGNLCLAMGWTGGILRAMQMNPEVQMVMPANNRALVFSFETLVILKKANHPEAAGRFIDFLSRPKVSARNANKTLYASPVKGVNSFLMPSVRGNSLIETINDNKGRMRLMDAPNAAQGSIIDALWDELSRK